MSDSLSVSPFSFTDDRTPRRSAAVPTSTQALALTSSAPTSPEYFESAWEIVGSSRSRPNAVPFGPEKAITALDRSSCPRFWQWHCLAAVQRQELGRRGNK